MPARTWLHPGEEVVVHVRPHWSFLWRPVVAVVLTIVGSAAALSQSAPAAVDDVLAALVVASLLWLVVRWARWSMTVMVVTTTRIVHRGGAFGRRVRSLPLVQVGDVSLRRRVRDRLVGTGDIVVTSIDAGREVFRRSPRPTAVIREVRRQVGRARASAVAPLGERAGLGGR